MRAIERWQPSKFVLKGSRLAAGHDLPYPVRFIAGLQAPIYQDLLHHHVRGRLLDLGCGQAPLYAVYRQQASEVICADWPGTMHGVIHHDVHVDLNHPLPFATATFDTVLLSDVLEHVAQPETAFSETVRVLRPAGKLLLMVPMIYGLHEDPHDYHRYTRYKLIDFCQTRGLEVLVLEEYGDPLEVGLDMLAKAFGRSTLGVWSHCALIDLIDLMRLRKVVNRMRRRYPLGYVLAAHKNS